MNPQASTAATSTATTTNKKVWVDGQLLPADEAKVSVFDHGLLYGDGVFEGIRIYNGRILKLATHLKRLYAGAELIDLKIRQDIDELTAATHETVKANGLANGYIRLVVTRGGGTLGLNPYLCDKSVTFIIADTIKLYPQEMYDHGMAIITAKTRRRPADCIPPQVKSLNYLNNIMAKIEAIRAKVSEALMLNHRGNVAECTGDNIFMVCDGVLITPPLSAGILPGITRGIVIDLARDAGVEVRETDFTLDELYAADECFLTGTAAEAIPVTKIDDKTIGDGQPGPISLRLIEAYRALVTNAAPED
ncbi:MAG: branched-chain-amino-acid transaminase [Phycisphaera sp.]|nr:branched-chain-amino-acid transaminase [Phycisphaera sp.]